MYTLYDKLDFSSCLGYLLSRPCAFAPILFLLDHCPEVGGLSNGERSRTAHTPPFVACGTVDSTNWLEGWREAPEILGLSLCLLPPSAGTLAWTGLVLTLERQPRATLGSDLSDH